jgi:hypothetical protein
MRYARGRTYGQQLELAWSSGDASRIVYELAPISDSHVHALSSAAFFELTVILSATRNAE